MISTILTNIGRSKLNSATPLDQLNITHVAVGDGAGGYPELDPSATSLVNETWRGVSSTPFRDPNNQDTIIFETTIPASVGGFFIREVGIIDAAGDLIAIGHTALHEKPDPATGFVSVLTVRLFVKLDNACDVDVEFDERTKGVISDVDQLEQTPGLYDGEVAWLASYHSGWEALDEPPKGAGSIAWKANSTTTADRGVTFAVTGVSTGRWQRQLDWFVTPEMFGAKSDEGYDSGPALAACFATGKKVIGSGLNYESSVPLVVPAKGQIVDLMGGLLTFTGSRFNDVAVTLDGFGSILQNAEVTSTTRKRYLVVCAGVNSKIENSKIYFSEPTNRFPLDDNHIIFGQAGVNLRGMGTSAYRCEIYQNDGAGVRMVTSSSLRSCKIWGNGGMGVHVVPGSLLRREIQSNEIYDNDGIGLLADGDGVVLDMSENNFDGNGRHGAYVRCHNSTLRNNSFTNNLANGLKVRDNTAVRLLRNYFKDNCQGGGTLQDLVYQTNNQGINGLTIKDNIIPFDSTAPIAIGLNFVGPSLQCDNLKVIGNTGREIVVAAIDAQCVSNTAQDIMLGTSVTFSPAEQTGMVVTRNKCDRLTLSGRAYDADIYRNKIGKLVTPTDGANRRNKLRQNEITAQDTPIQLRIFTSLITNDITFAGAFYVPHLREALVNNNTDFKINGNTFRNCTQRLISQYSSLNPLRLEISFNKYYGTGNGMFRLFGNNHVAIGNVNTGAGFSVWLNGNGSRLIGNIPTATATGTDNVIL